MSADLKLGVYDYDPNHFPLSFNEESECGQKVFVQDHMGYVFSVLTSQEEWKSSERGKTYEVCTETVELSHSVVELFEFSEFSKRKRACDKLYAIIDDNALIPQPIAYFKMDQNGVYRSCSRYQPNRSGLNSIHTFELNGQSWSIDQKGNVKKPEELMLSVSKGKEEDKSNIVEKKEKSSGHFSFSLFNRFRPGRKTTDSSSMCTSYRPTFS